MHVDPSRVLAPVLTARPPAAANWRAGELLFARVIGPATPNSSAASGHALLRIGTQLVSAHSRVPLVPGEVLPLRVTRLQPQPLLRVEQKPALAPAVSHALAESLPRQLDTAQFARLFRTLVTITPASTAATQTTTPSASPPGVAAEVVTAARTLIRSVPPAAEVLAPRTLAAVLSGIARADLNAVNTATMRSPGVATRPLTAPPARAEATALPVRYDTALARLADVLHAQPTSTASARDRLASPAPAPRLPTQSTHADPMTVRDVRPAAATATPARTSPPQSAAAAGGNGTLAPDMIALTELVDGALARLRGQQLLALHHQPANPLPLAVDLPVAWRERIDLWHFEFEHPPEELSSPDDGVGVRLLLQLDAERAVEAAISLRGGCIRVTLDSSSGALREALRAHLDMLAQQLEQQGLSAGTLRVAQLPAPPASGPRAPLVRERA